MSHTQARNSGSYFLEESPGNLANFLKTVEKPRNLVKKTLVKTVIGCSVRHPMCVTFRSWYKVMHSSCIRSCLTWCLGLCRAELHCACPRVLVLQWTGLHMSMFHHLCEQSSSSAHLAITSQHEQKREGSAFPRLHCLPYQSRTLRTVI